MEKRRIRLEINGVVCGLITQESEEYMQSLAGEVGEMMKEILAASPFVTREAAALTAALSYCDDAKKNGKRAFELQERVDELEVEAELWQEEKEEMLKSPGGDSALAEKLAKLEAENTALEEAAQKAHGLEERAAALEDENAALHEAVGAAENGDRELPGLRDRLAQLEAENASLREAAQAAPAAAADETDAGLAQRLQELTERNEALRREAEEQAELAQKAELEKQGAVSAAKRAVEEARKVVDQLREEAEQAKAEAEQAREKASAPALTTLERMAGEAVPEEPQGRGAALPKERAAGGTRRKRKNPLRYEEDFEQEGFVSFFEKK